MAVKNFVLTQNFTLYYRVDFTCLCVRIEQYKEINTTSFGCYCGIVVFVGANVFGG